MILWATASGTSGCIPNTNGWFFIDGTDLDHTAAAPVLHVQGKLLQAGTCAFFESLNNTTDGPNGGTINDPWVVKVRGSGGNDQNALYVDGYSHLDGNVHVGNNLDVGNDVAIGNDCAITGNLSKGGGSFLIDHPVDPEDKVLRHSFVESDEYKNIYDGRVVLDKDGKAVVQMPRWFMALNSNMVSGDPRDFNYQLTSIGNPTAPFISREIRDEGWFEISGAPGQTVCWQVTGVRKDRYVKANPLVVEEKKDEAFHDRHPSGYVHPELFNA
jgi:hypothetical protein